MVQSEGVAANGLERGHADRFNSQRGRCPVLTRLVKGTLPRGSACVGYRSRQRGCARAGRSTAQKLADAAQRKPCRLQPRQLLFQESRAFPDTGDQCQGAAARPGKPFQSLELRGRSPRCRVSIEKNVAAAAGMPLLPAMSEQRCARSCNCRQTTARAIAVSSMSQRICPGWRVSRLPR